MVERIDGMHYQAQNEIRQSKNKTQNLNSAESIENRAQIVGKAISEGTYKIADTKELATKIADTLL